MRPWSQARAQGRGILLGKTNTPGVHLERRRAARTTHLRPDAQRLQSRLYPSGSSGGAGAIVALAGSGLDIGLGLWGSIRLPAYVEGLAGIKFSTYGRSPRTGHRRLKYPSIISRRPGRWPAASLDLYLIPVDHLRWPDQWDAAMVGRAIGRSAEGGAEKSAGCSGSTNTGTVEASAEMQSRKVRCVGYFAAFGLQW